MNVTIAEEEILTACSIFYGISKEELFQFFKEANAHIKSYGKGEVLFYEGDFYDQISVILSGEAAIVRLYPDGTEHLFQKLSVGHLVGIEVACTETKISPYSTCALTDMKVLKFSYRCLETEGRVEERKRLFIQNQILKFIASENIKKYYKINILSSRSLRERILLYLEIQRKKKKSNVVTIPFDRIEFANYLCVNRSALSKELSKMQGEGLIRYHKNKFEILY